MEMLTKRTSEGHGYIPCHWKESAEAVDKGQERLADIEDILDDDYDLDRLRELVQADREGRCVVLSEPMSPMVQIPGDTDVYCPNCAQTLSGGWPLSDAGDYRKLCQCPNCGQAIDDTKCEIVYEVTKGEKHG